jgi:hypothetical protein
MGIAKCHDLGLFGSCMSLLKDIDRPLPTPPLSVCGGFLMFVKLLVMNQPCRGRKELKAIVAEKPIETSWIYV